MEYGKVSTGHLDVPNIIEVRSSPTTEVLRIAPDGNIYWHGRLVESDDDFKKSMLELAEVFKANYKRQQQEIY